MIRKKAAGIHGLIVTALMLLGAPSLQGVDLSKVRRHIYKIYATKQSHNYRVPWASGRPSQGTGSGFQVAGKGIITNAHVVADAVQVTVQRDGDDRPRPVAIKAIAHDADLALLEFPEDPSIDTKAGLPLGGLPKLQQKVATIGYPRGGDQISVTEGIVSRIAYRRYVHSGDKKHLLVQVDSAINPGNSGGPVVWQDQVVGVAFQAFTSAENTGYIIPVAVIERFLHDASDGRYDGHPQVGIHVMGEALANKDTREHHGLKEKEGGIKVSFVYHQSPATGIVEAGDVLLSINGQPIGVDGKITFSGERVDFRVLMDLARLGDTITFKAVRAKKRLTLKVVIKPTPPHYDRGSRYDDPPRFFVYAGMVFTDLSRNFLGSWGKSWFQASPIHLRYLHWQHPIVERFETSEEIVVLAYSLPHPVNRATEAARHGVVDKIDGQTINSLADVKRVLTSSTAQSPSISIEMWKDPIPVIIDRQQAAAAHQQILSRYRVSPAENL